MGGRRRRGGLADLIGEVGAAPQEREDERPYREAAAAEAREVRREVRPGDGEEATAPPAPAGPPAARSVGEDAAAPAQPVVPKYLALERKEARLRGDQVDALSSLARRVNRTKPSRGGERITENTLIRVAVDWLLGQEGYVGGSSEEEIRRGLGVPGPRLP